MKILRLKDFNFTFEHVCNNSDTRVVLEGVTPVHTFVDGKPKADEIVGFRYRVRLPYNENRIVFIKILGDPLVTEEDIKQHGERLILPEKVEIKLYVNKHGYPDYSLSASGFKFVEK